MGKKNRPRRTTWLFDEMLSIYTRMSDIENEEMFQHGFNLAVKLMSEAYSAKLPEKSNMK